MGVPLPPVTLEVAGSVQVGTMEVDEDGNPV